MKHAQRASRDVSSLSVAKNPRRTSESPQSDVAVFLSESSALSEAVYRALQLPMRAVALQFHEPGDVTRLTDSLVDLVVVVEPGLKEAILKITFSKRSWPHCRLLLVGLQSNENAVLQCMAAGADGVVTHEESFTQLQEAVQVVLDDEVRIPVALMRPILRRLMVLDPGIDTIGAKSRIRQLSLRENEILTCLADGMANKEIALRLHLEVQTVKNYVTRVLRKFGARTRFDVVRLAGALGSKGS